MVGLTVGPLCIIQARLNSTRLPGKMLLTLGDETLIARAWRVACEAFRPSNCVVMIPQGDVNGPLHEELRRIKARVFPSIACDHADVLGGFYACAHTYRWHPDSVIVRYTPDDCFKTPYALRAVAEGRRLPVEEGGEAFTLAMLDHAQTNVTDLFKREHITDALFPFRLPSPAHGMTIDTLEQYEDAKLKLGTI